MHIELLRIVHLSRIWQHFFRYHVQFSRYKSLKSELWNNHWKPGCGSRKVSTNRCSTIDILKCYWGYTLVDWNPWLHFWGIKCFLFSFRMCHDIFREYFQRSRFCFSSAMFVNADLLSPPGPNLTNMSPRPHVPISALWCPHVPIGCPYGHFRCVGGGPMPVSNSRIRRFRLAHR